METPDPTRHNVTGHEDMTVDIEFRNCDFFTPAPSPPIYTMTPETVLSNTNSSLIRYKDENKFIDSEDIASCEEETVVSMPSQMDQYKMIQHQKAVTENPLLGMIKSSEIPILNMLYDNIYNRARGRLQKKLNDWYAMGLYSLLEHILKLQRQTFLHYYCDPTERFTHILSKGKLKAERHCVRTQDGYELFIYRLKRVNTSCCQGIGDKMGYRDLHTVSQSLDKKFINQTCCDTHQHDTQFTYCDLYKACFQPNRGACFCYKLNAKDIQETPSKPSKKQVKKIPQCFNSKESLKSASLSLKQADAQIHARTHQRLSWKCLTGSNRLSYYALSKEFNTIDPMKQNILHMDNPLDHNKDGVVLDHKDTNVSNNKDSNVLDHKDKNVSNNQDKNVLHNQDKNVSNSKDSNVSETINQLNKERYTDAKDKKNSRDYHEFFKADEKRHSESVQEIVNTYKMDEEKRNYTDEIERQSNVNTHDGTESYTCDDNYIAQHIDESMSSTFEDVSQKLHKTPSSHWHSHFTSKQSDFTKIDMKPDAKCEVFYFQHGLLESSINWVSGGDKSLPFILAYRGCEVWIGNNRGNDYTRYKPEHTGQGGSLSALSELGQMYQNFKDGSCLIPPDGPIKERDTSYCSLLCCNCSGMSSFPILTTGSPSQRRKVLQQSCRSAWYRLLQMLWPAHTLKQSSKKLYKKETADDISSSGSKQWMEEGLQHAGDPYNAIDTSFCGEEELESLALLQRINSPWSLSALLPGIHSSTEDGNSLEHLPHSHPSSVVHHDTMGYRKSSSSESKPNRFVSPDETSHPQPDMAGPSAKQTQSNMHNASLNKSPSFSADLSPLSYLAKITGLLEGRSDRQSTKSLSDIKPAEEDSIKYKCTCCSRVKMGRLAECAHLYNYPPFRSINEAADGHWSFHEMAMYDFPSILQYIVTHSDEMHQRLLKSHQVSIHPKEVIGGVICLGQSQGSAQMFAATSMSPIICNLIQHLIAFSPPIILQPASTLPAPAYVLLKFGMENPTTVLKMIKGAVTCTPGLLLAFWGDFVAGSRGIGSMNFYTTRLQHKQKVINFKYTPSGSTSKRNFTHWLQQLDSNKPLAPLPDAETFNPSTFSCTDIPLSDLQVFQLSQMQQQWELLVERQKELEYIERQRKQLTSWLFIKGITHRGTEDISVKDTPSIIESTEFETTHLSYPIQNIKCPIHVFLGAKDNLVNSRATQEYLRKVIPPELLHIEVHEEFGHLDFGWGRERVNDLYPRLIQCIFSDTPKAE